MSLTLSLQQRRSSGNVRVQSLLGAIDSYHVEWQRMVDGTTTMGTDPLWADTQKTAGHIHTQALRGATAARTQQLWIDRSRQVHYYKQPVRYHQQKVP